MVKSPGILIAIIFEKTREVDHSWPFQVLPFLAKLVYTSD